MAYIDLPESEYEEIMSRGSLQDRIAKAQTEYEVALENLKALRVKCDLSPDGEDEFNVALADVQNWYHEIKSLETLRAWS